MVLCKCGVLNPKSDHSNLQVIKEQYTTFYLTQHQLEFTHVEKIDKFVFGKTQCKDIKKYRNGKNKSIKAHSGTILKLSLSKSDDFLVSCSSDKTIKVWSA